MRNLDSEIPFSYCFPPGSKDSHFSTSDSDSSTKTEYVDHWECLESQIWQKSLRNPDPERNLVFSYQMHRVYYEPTRPFKPQLHRGCLGDVFVVALNIFRKNILERCRPIDLIMSWLMLFNARGGGVHVIYW